MTDFLRPIGKTGQILAVLGLALVAVTTAGLNLLIAAAFLAGFRPPAQARGPFVGTALLFGLLSLISIWMLCRLLRKRRAANGVTLMPTWFIEVFGLVFGIGILVTAVLGGENLFLFEGLAVAAAMLFIRRSLRKHARLETRAEQ